MHFVPIPNTDQYLYATAPHWMPFLPAIARHSKEPIKSLLGQIARHEVQLALVWDGEKAHALIGIRLTRRGSDLIGEIAWLAGKGMRQWQSLLSELEQYLRDIGCVEIRVIGRPGWVRMSKGKGYKITHYQMEKVL